MSQKVTDSALISCSQGTQTSNLVVTSQNFSTVEGKLIATEEDKSISNIMSFGYCKLKNLPCTPVSCSWQKTAEKDKILSYKMLTESSFCICSIGGRIEINDKGYGGRHVIE